MRRDDNTHTGSAPVAHLLRQGQEWSIGEYLCTAGPNDRPFEERREQVAVAAVIEGSFRYRGDTGTAVMHPGAFLLGNAATCYECGHDHSSGDRCIAFHLAPAYFAEVAASIAGSGRFRFPTPMLPAAPKLLPWLVRIETRAARADRLAIDEAVPRLMEAVIGAVYLANGWQKVMELVDHHFAAALEGVADGRSGYDYKTRLQEEIQNRLRLAPKYRVISETGPDHEKTFEVEVAVNPDLTARGTGRSKKEAEQAAARALSQLLSATEK